MLVAFFLSGGAIANAQQTCYVAPSNCFSPPCGTSGYPCCKIQDAIDASVPGDIVVVRDGTYTGTGNWDISFNGKAITVRGENGPENCIIDLQEDPHAGFIFNHGETNQARLVGLTIQNGYLGAVYILDASPSISDCEIKNNGAQGINAEGISLATIDHCFISGNHNLGEGGGIFTNGHNADYSAGVTISNCTIVNNSSYSNGGGITAEGVTTIQNCVISNNSSDGPGGGLFGAEGVRLVDNTRITGNYSAYDGGGCFFIHGSAWSVNTIRNSVIADNETGPGGYGAIVAGYGWIQNSVVWGNIPAQTKQVFFDGYFSSPLTIEYSDVQGGRLVGTGGFLYRPIWGAGNLGGIEEVDNPRFVDPDGPDNDPETYDDNNYRLRAVSPVIDAASNWKIDDVVTDLDGHSRFSDGPAVATGQYSAIHDCAVADMGPFEFIQCPTGNVVSAIPASGTRDARQPHPQGDNSFAARQGIGSANSYTGGPEPIVITLDVCGAGSTECWELCETGIEQVDSGPPLSANSIVRVTERPNEPGVYELLLDRPISAGYWTTINYVGGGETVSYASLPGNANGDNYSNVIDQLDLIDCMNGQMWRCPYGLYSADLDHSDLFAPADYLNLIDLHNGAGMFIPWYGKSLSINSCLGGTMMAGGGPSSGEVAAEGPLDPQAEHAYVADWFVVYLVKANPTDSAKIEEFQMVVDSLTDWCVEHLTGDEKKSLADRLSDAALTFASDAAAKAAAKVTESLGT